MACVPVRTVASESEALLLSVWYDVRTYVHCQIATPTLACGEGSCLDDIQQGHTDENGDVSVVWIVAAIEKGS